MAALLLRSATEEDLPFLLELRRQTMLGHLVASGASPTEAQMLARVRLRFDCASIVMRQGQPVGLMKLVREGAVWELLQIQLSPAVQGEGLGRRLIEGVLSDARRHRVAVRLSVLRANPARCLYERLGFRIVASSETAHEMLWQA